MGEDDGIKMDVRKLIVAVIIISILLASTYYIIKSSTQSLNLVHPKFYWNISKNGTITQHRITHVEYHYSPSYFHMLNVTIVAYSLISFNNSIQYGQYYCNESLADFPNNETSPVNYFDNDHNSILSEGDYFICDTNKSSENNIVDIGFYLWITYNETNISIEDAQETDYTGGIE